MLSAVDDLLRSGSDATDTGHPWSTMRVVGLTAAAAAGYGAVVGAWSLSAGQVLFSAVKVPLLMLASTALCVPSFFVVNALVGLRDDFPLALRGILATQASFAVCLLSLAPIVATCYTSGLSYESIKLANAAMFPVAALGSHVTLIRRYRPLVRKDRRHRIALLCWSPLYLFVAAQLAYTLRPFIGAPYLRAQFLRPDAWQNVYVELAYMVWGWSAGL